MELPLIDTESEQIREVFAQFGLAAYRAQCLERELTSLLAAQADPTVTSRAEFDKILERLDSRTLGQLVREIRTTLEMDEEESARLELGLQIRNWITHQYFWARAVAFLSEAGRASMISELQEASDFLLKLDELFTKRTLERGEAIGMTTESLDRALAELIGENEFRGIPFWHKED